MYPYPAMTEASPAITQILSVLKGTGKLTDPADVHAAWVLLGIGSSKLLSDGSAPGQSPPAPVTHAELIPHLEAGLLGGGLLGGGLIWSLILPVIEKLIASWLSSQLGGGSAAAGS